MPKPKVKDIKEELRREHSCNVIDEPMFPGPDNEDGPLITTITNPGNGKELRIALPPDDRDAEPSLVEHVCDRLGISHCDLMLSDGDGGTVSVRPPSEPPDASPN